MLRKVVMMRRVLHVKGDVMCTLVLLVALCFLLYARQVVLSAGWNRSVWQLQIHGSTSSSRSLLGSSSHTGRKEALQSTLQPQLPSCKPRLKSKPSQSKSSSQIRSRSRKKKVIPTVAAGKRLPTLPPFDFERYLREKDKRNFNLLIDQPDKCRIREEEEGGERGGAVSAPYMLIAVKSTAADFDKRQYFKVYSLSYREPKIWFYSSCPHVKFIFKGDADVYVNVENILEMLQGREPEKDLFVGDIIVNAKPIRRRTSKYYVPEFVYGGGLYPSYAGGGGFVMSGHTARRLSSACQQVELFPIDDVFLGMCLQLIGVKPLRHQGFRTFGIPRPSAAPHLQTFDPCFYRELMVVHSLGVPQIWLMWNLLHDPKLSCHYRHGQTSGPFKWRGSVGEMAADEADYGEKPVFLTH
ncbi:UDP-GlcNAc:betaGal beta-1,3-N-acetylglucosaminyltransferase 9 [Gambusia affinis]|uniref:UDP-GlcNAc:betaGal beta-1,3-N-acetylglucosaminyltransferase 9 n=1 Tax=Gambusia affinis TaxID=33528 RepID=UPI001CDD4B3C|nr:UDP-GlcNAc:betaGal beta-1,3-N-acetylglucosaminyltransferase 9 [Gambusia affinis]